MQFALSKKSSAVHPSLLRYIPLLVAALLAQLLPTAPKTWGQTTTTVPELHIRGEVSTQLMLTAAELKKMPRKILTVVNPHEKKTENYEGVLLEELLRRAGTPLGEQLRGPAMATYVIAEAADGYRVVFSLAELDSGISDSEFIVADTLDGAPMGAPLGPFRLVAPHEKRPARWVRMLKAITVVRVPTQ
jgi:DMSO/TMAO reductase YedYZ molybdopterin-dependent catalytic subunit